ncbi:MAG: hypothetical protein KIT84_13560 [Labilithrix sp.]|nr:hypothetical protein [Labilithrix sp.]MCW5812045.1 hypothetical protein [Labilithrix sp.]
MRGLRLVFVVSILGAATYAAACGEPLDIDEPADGGGTVETSTPDTPDALPGDGDTGVVDGADGNPPGACFTSPFNANDCPCQDTQMILPCSYGLTKADGGATACTQGTQRCVQTNTGLRWEQCANAERPAMKEECFNSIDDDCNGIADDGCPCADIDLCKMPDGGTYPDGRHVFTVPAAPKASEGFDIFIISKAASIPPLDLLRNGECFGEGQRRTCATAGAGCPGWAVARYRDPAPAGTYTYRFETVVGSTSAPCDPQGSEFATATVTVAP